MFVEHFFFDLLLVKAWSLASGDQRRTLKLVFIKINVKPVLENTIFCSSYEDCSELEAKPPNAPKNLFLAARLSKVFGRIRFGCKGWNF